MLQWAREAVARGYVAFLVDGFGQRNVDSTCYGAKNGVNLVRNVKDALQAAEHLRKLDFVDGKRIALAGYSHGAMIGLAAASRRWSTILGTGPGFAAIVSFYPGCFSIRPAAGTPYELIDPDIDRPLLVLMAEKDNETPAQECVAKLEPLKTSGAPVHWHIYPGATHCWDCENLHGVRKVDFRGSNVVYYYDRETTRDSAKRMFEFFEKAFTGAR
jgi:dienelactone hydrolase